MSFHVQPSFELDLFVFSKGENLAPLKGPRKVLPWLLRTQKVSTAHSWHGSIRKQPRKFAQRSRLYPGHTGPREGYKCSGIWKDPCHYRQPWKQKAEYNIIPATASPRGSILAASLVCYFLIRISLQAQFKCSPHALGAARGISGVLQVTRRLWSYPAQGRGWITANFSNCSCAVQAQVWLYKKFSNAWNAKQLSEPLI